MFIRFPSNPFNNPLDVKSSIYTNLIKTLLFLFHQKPECFGIHYEVVTIYKLKRNIEQKYVKINSNPTTLQSPWTKKKYNTAIAQSVPYTSYLKYLWPNDKIITVQIVLLEWWLGKRE